jgi:hypothetical protein
MPPGDPVTDLLLRGISIPEHVVFRSFVNETVVLNLQTQKFHGLNASAGRMAEVLDREKSVGAALEVIAKDFGVPEREVEPYLRDFVDTMVERGLLVVDDG